MNFHFVLIRTWTTPMQELQFVHNNNRKNSVHNRRCSVRVETQLSCIPNSNHDRYSNPPRGSFLDSSENEVDVSSLGDPVLAAFISQLNYLPVSDRTETPSSSTRSCKYGSQVIHNRSMFCAVQSSQSSQVLMIRADCKSIFRTTDTRASLSSTQPTTNHIIKDVS